MLVEPPNEAQGLIASTGPAFPADHYLVVANGYFEAGVYARAAEVCERGVREHPTDPCLWDRLGMARWAVGEWAAAATALRTAEQFAPLRPLARLALADAERGRGRTRAAVRQLTVLATARGMTADLLSAVARRLFEVGTYRRAERVWRRVIRRRPRWADAHYQLASCLSAQRVAPEELFEPLNEAAQLAPDEPKYALALANAWVAAGSPCDAAEVLTTVNPRRVHCPDCRRRAADVFRDVGDDASAAAWEATERNAESDFPFPEAGR